MPDYSQRVSDSFNERMRLIRFRRRKESSRFRDELKIIPRWLIWTVLGLYVVALVLATLINLSGAANNGEIFPPELKNNPALASLALGGIVTGVSLFMAAWILLIGYVNRDAKRRGMNSGLWTVLVLVLSPAYLLLGFLIYFLLREPLPYACPQCGATVGARFNFCPNCKYNLHPSCPNCKREVVETDKYCPYCACELAAAGAEPQATQKAPL